jgi:altronate hydrolase
MARTVLRIHPDDDLLVALADQSRGSLVTCHGHGCVLAQDVPAKHKFVTRDVAAGERLKMYGVTVGQATIAILAGGLITTQNFTHAVDEVVVGGRKRAAWHAPDVSRFENKTFDGFHRPGGKVGTANYWIVVPMVFCENRNLISMREALLEELGYRRDRHHQWQARRLVEAYRAGSSAAQIAELNVSETAAPAASQRVFPNIDGVKFLTHTGGCGGTREDSGNLCALLAGYISHPNVAGATVLSLGCQHAQVETLVAELEKRNYRGPLHVFDQQKIGSESTLMEKAIRATFAGLVTANEAKREPAGIDKLVVGVKCGGSDGFSGISANPAMGHAADVLAALGGSVLLAEFPELAGTEQELVDRCEREETAHRFLAMMRSYNDRAKAVGSGFDRNPSPGNIADGLITDAMKSAGAVRKGGTSPVVDVLDYTEPVTRAGLSLLCSPGNDVESTTAMTGSGANVILFSTGLGTPTGNPITPVLKIATNSEVARRMADIIDYDTGPIIRGEATIESAGERVLDLVIETASGRHTPMAVRLGQDDFIPWKRGVSL